MQTTDAESFAVLSTVSDSCGTEGANEDKVGVMDERSSELTHTGQPTRAVSEQPDIDGQEAWGKYLAFVAHLSLRVSDESV